jgi:hypothetical protein
MGLAMSLGRVVKVAASESHRNLGIIATSFLWTWLFIGGSLFALFLELIGMLGIERVFSSFPKQIDSIDSGPLVVPSSGQMTEPVEATLNPKYSQIAKFSGVLTAGLVFQLLFLLLLVLHISHMMFVSRSIRAERPAGELRWRRVGWSMLACSVLMIVSSDTVSFLELTL